ncbi:unnamed protein product [Oncorhynchus mykiss]|uniref:Chemokine interleukin-8-like domain-containing protein n=1 Tax=Oncorhynchus mykiss TaxID=8022 RepID=A0A060XF71_ONCMY|nr:unnamed protein product [Oncorhynchus mykiss]
MFSSTSAAYGPRKLYCCVEFQEKPVPYTKIIGYKQQSYKEVCNNDAIIFYTTKNKKVCASIKDEWLQTEEDIHSNTVMAKPPQPTLKGRFTHSDTTFSNRNINSNNPIE